MLTVERGLRLGEEVARGGAGRKAAAEHNVCFVDAEHAAVNHRRIDTKTGHWKATLKAMALGFLNNLAR